MAKHTFKNISTGIRGFHSVDGLVELAPDGVAEDIEVSDAELKSARRTGWFEITSGGGGHGDPDKPRGAAADGDDLDTTVPNLRKIAEAEEVDLSGMTSKGDIQNAIRLHRTAKATTQTESDELDGMDDATLRSTVSAITGKSAEEVADLDRPALLALARGNS